MLNADILDTLKSYTENMSCPVSFVVQEGAHDKRSELMSFLADICSVSDFLSIQEADLGLRSPISFCLFAKNVKSGISFSGIPSGHEFNSLVLAVLQLGGTDIKIDDSLKTILRNVKETIHFEVFVSLSCQNCPDVVQTLNQFAQLNPKISTEMIDGGLFQNVIADRDIQGVPSVYANGELFANGKIDTTRIIDLLAERDPGILEIELNDSLPLQDVTVIGGGPAGVSSAIYAARKGLKVTLVTDRLGGQLKDTLGIENFISLPKTTGNEMTEALRKHLAEYAINIKENLRVNSIETENVKKLNLTSGEIIASKTLIIATGANWRALDIPGEKENIGNGVAYCPHCDGPFFKDKDVAVIGGGNSGIEAALDLSSIVDSVTVLEFLPELKADEVLVQRAESTSNINIIKNVETKAITAKDGKVTGLDYADRETGAEHHQRLDGVFVQIGLVPNSSFVEGLIELTPWGEIIVDERGQTSVEGIFACGDVTTVPYKQIVIAMGEGSKAGLTAFEYLLTHEVDKDPLAA